MRGLRLSPAHAVPRCAQEVQEAETKTVKEVDEQPRNRQELVFEIVRSTSPSSSFISHHLPFPLIYHLVSSSSSESPSPPLLLRPIFSNMLLIEISDQKIIIDM